MDRKKLIQDSELYRGQLSFKRNELRARLSETRAKRVFFLSEGNVAPSVLEGHRGLLEPAYECAYCGKSGVLAEMDVGEFVVQRSDVQGGSDELRLEIHVDWNCGFVHRKCHPFTEGGAGQVQCIMYLIRYEGIIAIRKGVMRLISDFDFRYNKPIQGRIETAGELLYDAIYG
jgi:hypothetical protein